MNLVRKYIRNIILAEGMIAPASVDSRLAIWTDWSPDSDETRFKFVLYDPAIAMKNIEYFYPGRLEAMDGMWRWVYISDLTPGRWENMEQAVVAVMSVWNHSAMGSSRPCHGAWEVKAAAALGGYGPTLYDLVMSISPGGLFADRTSVSGEAAEVWDFYSNNRPEIEKKVMDGARFTPLNFDDNCYVHNEDHELAITLSKERVYAFLKQYGKSIGDAEIVDYFKEEVEFDRDGIPIEKSYGENIFRAFVNWFDDEYSLPTRKMELDWEEWQRSKPLSEYINFQLTDPDFLDIVYNTDYAVSSMEKMIANHEKMLKDIRNLGINYGSEEAVNRGFAKIPREFFNEHYN